MEEIRIQKYLSDCGILSRRAAEREIRERHITVNGMPAEIGQKVDPRKDEIRFCGKVIKAPRGRHYIYIMLNKPVGYVTTMQDEKGRKCVADLVKDVEDRVYPVGRLDMDSEGMLLMTNDGELANALMHPRHHIPKIYHVITKETVTKEQLIALSAPMDIDGYSIMPVETKLIKQLTVGSLLQMTLYEGRNRQIRKMCEQVGVTVKRLRRIAIGNLELGTLPVGKWEYLTKEEIAYLKQAEQKKQEKQ